MRTRETEQLCFNLFCHHPFVLMNFEVRDYPGEKIFKSQDLNTMKFCIEPCSKKGKLDRC